MSGHERHWMRALSPLARLGLVLPGVLITLLLLAPPASAHPLGNFSVNSYSGLSVEPHAVDVQLIVDSAEIPTIQQFPEARGQETVAEGVAADYAARECDRLRPGLQLTLDGAPQQLAVIESSLDLQPGQAGLSTMRLTCDLRTQENLDTVGHSVGYVDQNSLDRTGWREVTVQGDGVTLAESTVPSTSVSQRLTDYPEDLLESPLDQRSATTRVMEGDGVVENRGTQSPSSSSDPADAGMGRLADSFTNLMSARELGLGFGLVAFGISILLGALHAFAPGHGKTLMAAYLIGKRSSLRQVGIIGLTVTLTHTAGVLILGVVLSAVALTAPDRIYGWLGLASGVILVGIGTSLLRQARRRADAPPAVRAAELVSAEVAAARSHDHSHDHAHAHDHDHSHDHDHDHDHDHGHSHDHGLTHSHGWGGTHTHPPPATSARGLVAVGFAGGMVPSPSALIVLLGGIALGRVWFGVLLVLGYGIGMALALIGTGLALAHARDRVERWAEKRQQASDGPGPLLGLVRHLPTATAALVMAVGIGLAIRSALTL